MNSKRAIKFSTYTSIIQLILLLTCYLCKDSQKLYINQLPFSAGHQLLVKDVMVVEADKKWILRAKSGWDGRQGWWIGWVEWQAGPVFFALNIDTPNRFKDFLPTKFRPDNTRARIFTNVP